MGLHVEPFRPRSGAGDDHVASLICLLQPVEGAVLVAQRCVDLSQLTGMNTCFVAARSSNSLAKCRIAP